MKARDVTFAERLEALFNVSSTAAIPSTLITQLY
jgi:hypothetical protein